MHNPFSLAGKKILVTGASSGIGRQTAIECANLGASLIITGRDESRLFETFSALEGESHKMVIADLTDQTSRDTLIAELPKLDGIVLCAGKNMNLPITFSTRQKFDSVFEINYFAQVETLRLLSKKKKLEKGCSIVFVSSIGGVFNHTVGGGIYGATKSALHSTMKFFAIEFAARQVRVNSVNPGMVETPLIHDSPLSEEELAKDVDNYPLGRYGEPKDVAYGIIYLLSDAASWVTGHALVIDGGVTI